MSLQRPLLVGLSSPHEGEKERDSETFLEARVNTDITLHYIDIKL